MNREKEPTARDSEIKQRVIVRGCGVVAYSKEACPCSMAYKPEAGAARKSLESS